LGSAEGRDLTLVDNENVMLCVILKTSLQFRTNNLFEGSSHLLK
jgi:hypothetical protein